MRQVVSLLILLGTGLCSLGPTARGQSGGGESPVAAKSVAYWVQQLGHDHYLRRELATKKLIEAGPAAIADLSKVIREGDLEVVERAVEVITTIAIAGAPQSDGGAWDTLHALATQGAGRRASSAKGAIDEIRRHRARRAHDALAGAGIFVGIDDFAVGAISESRLIVQIGKNWRGRTDSLQWLSWLEGIENARVEGPAVTLEVLQSIIKVPGLKTLAIIDGQVDDAVLHSLTKMERIHSLEFRYVPLTDEQGDLIAAMPIRVSLILMGTGISAEKVDSMRGALPGLRIEHRQGGFLGVECMDGSGACRISRVLEDSAAEEAGLIMGDVIVGVGDTEVARFKDLQNAINQHLPGDDLNIKFQRGDKIETVRVRLRRFEES